MLTIRFWCDILMLPKNEMVSYVLLKFQLQMMSFLIISYLSEGHFINLIHFC